jgi:hypothetical protein
VASNCSLAAHRVAGAASQEAAELGLGLFAARLANKERNEHKFKRAAVGGEGPRLPRSASAVN